MSFLTMMLICGRCFAFCPEPAPPPVCEEFFDAHAVFLGTAVGSRLDVDKDGFIVGYYFDLRVEKNFKGASKKSIEVYMPNDSARFDELEKGHRYLLFAYSYKRHSHALEINGCGNSTDMTAGFAGQSIAELERLANRKPGDGGYIQGNVNNDGSFDDGPEGVLVIAQGERNRYTALTGQRGAFKIHVPAGKYSVHGESKDWYIAPNEIGRTSPDAVEIEDGKCVALEFDASSKVDSKAK